MNEQKTIEIQELAQSEVCDMYNVLPADEDIVVHECDYSEEELAEALNPEHFSIKINDNLHLQYNAKYSLFEEVCY